MRFVKNPEPGKYEHPHLIILRFGTCRETSDRKLAKKKADSKQSKGEK